jgi:hypothetical protein
VVVSYRDDGRPREAIEVCRRVLAENDLGEDGRTAVEALLGGVGVP